MPNAPWLSEPFSYEDYNGDWNSFISDVYLRFHSDLRDGLELRGKPVRHSRSDDHGYERGFWHIVSEGDDRTPDIRRAERIGWYKETVQNCDAPEVCRWRRSRGKSSRVHLWIPEDDYILVLEERRNLFWLITAFTCIKPHRMRQFVREHKENANGATPF